MIGLRAHRWRRAVTLLTIVALTIVALTMGALTMGALLPAAGQTAAAAVVSAAQVQDLNDRTRVVLDLDRSVAVRVFRLDSPDRVVIDLERVRWRAGAVSRPVTSTVVARLRYGNFNPTTSRIVLDCRRPVQVAHALAATPAGGHQLILDLVAEGEPPTPGPTTAASRAAARSTSAAAVARSITAPSRKPPPPQAKRIIVLDPGHGGIDPGAMGVSGILEKDLTLGAARRLREHLQRTGRYTVVMTRDRDVHVRLRRRIEIARAAGADMFLSLHADAHPDARVQGASVYTLSEQASDVEAAALAERENKADLILGVDLSNEAPEVANILIDLTRRETNNQSSRLAGDLVRELKRQSKLLRNSHRFAGFAVLKAPDVPSVLIELGYLSNANDDKKLRRHDYMDALAAAITRAVDGFFTEIETAERR